MGKRCPKCLIEKAPEAFNADRNKRDGLTSYCRECSRQKCAEWAKANADKKLAGRKADYEANKEAYKRRAREWREANPDRVRELSQRYSAENKSAIREAAARYYQENKEELGARRKRYAVENPDRMRELRRAWQLKAQQSVGWRLRRRISKSLRRALPSGKNGAWTMDLLGYTLTELRAHIERQFVKGMGWHNMDEWHIDHIIPVSAFDIQSVDDPAVRRAWALTNLRPLWASENCSKGARILSLL